MQATGLYTPPATVGFTWEMCVPTRALERKSLYDRLTKLELDLTEAIKTERYEDAARARDAISQVKQSFNPDAAR